MRNHTRPNVTVEPTDTARCFSSEGAGYVQLVIGDPSPIGDNTIHLFGAGEDLERILTEGLAAIREHRTADPGRAAA